MIILSLFRLLIIFPFIVYMLLILSNKTKKEARLIIAPFYFISCGFITKFLLETNMVILVLSIIVIITIFVAIINIRREYKIFNMLKLIREIMYTFSTLYPLIYFGLLVYGIGSIYITMR